MRERYNSLDDEVRGDELLSWLYLLTVGFGNEEEADEIMYIYPDLAEFAEMYGYALDDPKVVRAYEDHASAYREYHSRKDYIERKEREAAERGYADGEAKGFSDGYADGKAKGYADGEAKGFADGKAKGYADGEAQGIEQGIEQGLEMAAARLRAAGVDEETVRVALGNAASSN